MRYLLAAMIVLALIDAVLHFSIDAFVNKTFTNLPYGPLFVALPIGYLVLIALLLMTRSASITTQRLVTAALAVYVAIPLVAYFVLTGGRYNPFQLATIAKPLEVALLVVSIVYFVLLGRQQPVTGTTSAQSATAR
ncbi:MAG TPA: hypothetical protein VGJ60_13800 [Chloroflexota bacterium]|jgi:hypothetical protein